MMTKIHRAKLMIFWICACILVSYSFAQSTEPQSKPPDEAASSQDPQKAVPQPGKAQPAMAQPASAADAPASASPASAGGVARSARLGNTPCNNPEAPAPATSTSAASTSAVPAPPSEADIKQANDLYQQAVELDTKGDFDLALDVMDQSLKLDPSNTKHMFAREYMKQELISTHIHVGDEQMAQGNVVLAALQFRLALQIDPQDPTANQRMQSVLESNLKNNQD